MRKVFFLLSFLYTVCASAADFNVDSWLNGSTSSMTGWVTHGFYVLTWGNYYNGDYSVSAPFIEKWHDSREGGLGSDSLFQHLEYLPAGQYTLSADLISNYQANPSATVRGVNFICDNSSVSVSSGNGVPVHKSCDIIFNGGTLKLGIKLENATANWVAIDNLHLVFKGTSNQLISGEKTKVLSELSDYYDRGVAQHKVDSIVSAHTTTLDIFNALETLRKSVANLPQKDPIAKGLRRFSIGGHTPAYDELTQTYLVTVPEVDYNTNYSAIISYEKAEGWSDLTIDGNTVHNGEDYIFKDLSGQKTYTISTVDDNNRTIERKLTFTSLPVVQIYGTFSNDYSKGYIRVSEPNKANAELLNMKAKWRGGITNGNDKHKRNYHVKLQTSDGEKDEQEFFGLREDNSWILESCQVDMSRCRNRVLTDLWNDFSTPPYYKPQEKKARTGTRGHFVELFLNNKYSGIYCMTENMDRKQMKLKKQDSDGTNHGLLWKSKDWSYGVFMGHNYDNNYYPHTSPSAYNNGSEMWENYTSKYPDFEDNGNQSDWSTLYDAVNFVCTSSDKEFARDFGSYFDYPVILDYYILMETTLSADNHGKNMFFAVYDKQKDKKITIGVWDMDATMGQRWSDAYFHNTNIMNPESDYAQYITQHEHGDYNLFKRLRETNYHNFNEEVRQRYSQLRQSWLNTDSILARFKRYLDLFKNSGAESREAARWNGDSDISGHNIDFSNEYEYLSDWITRRMNYLDKTRFDIASLSTGISKPKYDGFSVSVFGNKLSIISDREQTINVYSLNGTLVRRLHVSVGNTEISDLPLGVYIVGNKKVALF